MTRARDEQDRWNPQAAPATRPRRKLALRLLASLLLTLTALLGAALLWAPRYLEGRAADELRQRAEARGWQLQWERIEVGYDLQARISKLRITTPNATAHIDAVEARWTLADLLERRTTPKHVRVIGLDALLDMAAPPDASPPPGAPAAAPRLAEAHLPTLTLEDARIRLRNLPGGAPEAELADLSIQGRPAGRGDWSGRWVARCVKGCGRPQRLTGELGRSQADGLWARARLERPLPLSLAALDGPVELREVGASLNPADGVLHVAALGVEAPIQSAGWSGRLRVERVEVALQAGASHQVTLKRPSLELRRAPAPPEAIAVLTAPDAPRLDVPSTAPLIALLESLERRLHGLTVEDGTLSLGPDLQAHALTLSRDPDTGDLRASAALWGGRVEATITPGGSRVDLQTEGVSIVSALRLLQPAWAERLGGHGEGRVTLELSPPSAELPRGRYALTADLRLREGRLWHAGLSPAPIEGQRADLRLTARYAPEVTALRGADQLELERLEIGLPAGRHGVVVLHGRGEVERLLTPGRPRFALTAWTPEMDCAAAVDAIPAAMLPKLKDELHLSGRFAPRINLRADLEDPHSLRLDLDGLPGTCAVADLGAFSPEFLNDRFQREVREGVSRPGIFVGPGTRGYTPLEQIPPYVQAAMYLTEEISFYKNAGFGLGLIRRALILNLEKGRYVYGGSTVSQQLVKNLFLTRHKTLSRKLEEAFIVWRMEEVVEKDRILELYLNCIEFGPDIYGIDAASRFYFDKAPRDLTPLEGAFLAGLKPSPLNGGGFRETGRTPDKGWWLKRHSRIMKRLYQFGHITEQQYRDSFPFILYFPNWSGEPVVLRDLETLKKQEVELPDEVIAAEGRLSWAPSPEQDQGLPPDAPAPPPTPEPEPTLQPINTAEPSPWLRIDDLPRQR